jgi:hypothetical protein
VADSGSGSTVSPVPIPTRVDPVDPQAAGNAGRYSESVRLASAMAPLTGPATKDGCVDARTLIAATIDDTGYEIAGRRHQLQAGFTACAFTGSQELRASVFEYADNETATAAGEDILDQAGVVFDGKAKAYHNSGAKGWTSARSQTEQPWAVIGAVQGRLVVVLRAQNSRGGTGKQQAGIAVAGLTAQLAALKSYRPTATDRIAGLPADPLLSRLIPSTGDDAQRQGSQVGVFPLATYQRFWNPAYLPAESLKAAKVDRVALGGATVLRAADPAAAKRVRDALYQAESSAPFHPAKATSPAGVDGAKCLTADGASKLFYCAVSVGRYAFVVEHKAGNAEPADREEMLDRPVAEQARLLAG